MRGTLYLLLSLLFTGVMTSCEDIIQLETPKTSPYLVVEATLTNLPGVQTIRLFKSQSYFDNKLPEAATGAKVLVKDNEGNQYEFIESKVYPGIYEWRPTNNKPLGKIRNTYQLSINWNGEELEAQETMNRVPAIDSIYYQFTKASVRQSGEGKPEEGYEAHFLAKDFFGIGDCYRLKTYKNGVLFNEPNNLTVIYDAGFQKGPQSDGLVFILPVRSSISPELYLNGDTLMLELLSISEAQFDFYSQARLEINNAGLFARPAANIPTNLFNKNKAGKWQGAGWFGVSAVSRKMVRIDSTKAVSKLF